MNFLLFFDSVGIDCYLFVADFMEDQMQVENQSARRNVCRQFSLSILMLLVTGIACYLGGRIHGYRQGIAIWDSAKLISYNFYVSDLLPSPSTDTKLVDPFELLAQQIKNEVMPGVWTETGGKGTIQYFDRRLRVTSNLIVIDAVEKF
ncbi:MAG: hypothetical protein ABL921_34175 [Pirellula sp.]